MTVEALALQGHERVLEIGTGSGYAAAILGLLAREVETIERIPELASIAAERLARLGLSNVHVHCADGTLGWPPNAPYEAICVAAGAPRPPKPLLDQLAIGGRLVIPHGDASSQHLVRIIRRDEQDFVEEDLGEVRFVPLVGEAGWPAAAYLPDQAAAAAPGDASIDRMTELQKLLARAAELSVQQGLATEDFMNAAWNAHLDANPGMRQELIDRELRAQLKKPAQAGPDAPSLEQRRVRAAVTAIRVRQRREVAVLRRRVARVRVVLHEVDDERRQRRGRDRRIGHDDRRVGTGIAGRLLEMIVAARREHDHQEQRALHGDPGIGLLRYGNALPNCVATVAAPSTSGAARIGAWFWSSRKPIATRSSMSTVSSPGRRPFGKPAGSQPVRDRFSVGPCALSAGGSKHVAAPRAFCDARGRRRAPRC